MWVCFHSVLWLLSYVNMIYKVQTHSLTGRWLLMQYTNTTLLHVYAACTTRKTSSCGGPIAAGAKTTAIGCLLRRVLGLPLYMKSIAAGY